LPKHVELQRSDEARDIGVSIITPKKKISLIVIKKPKPKFHKNTIYN